MNEAPTNLRKNLILHSHKLNSIKAKMEKG